MSEEIELKRCPHCGDHTAQLLTDKEFSVYPTLYLVICKAPYCGLSTEAYDNETDAVNAWNVRPLEEELERTIAALVGAVKFALASADFAANMNAREAEARLRSLIGETL